jgi:hypothetical protein
MAHSVVHAWKPEERRAKLARIINECDGVHLRVAHRLRVHRSSLYRYCVQYNLWPIFNAVRAARIEKRNVEKQKKYRGHGVNA